MLSTLLPLTALLGHAMAVTQPLNTTIIGQYGHSPAVLPSRMYSLSYATDMKLTSG